VIIDFVSRKCRIFGVSSIHLVRECDSRVISEGTEFPLSELGPMLLPDPLDSGIPSDVWDMVTKSVPEDLPEETPSPEVVSLAEERLLARNRKDWLTADALRRKITSLGWSVKDTPDGYNLAKS
jgi:hypothetical protein